MLTNPGMVNGQKMYYDLAKIRERQYRMRVSHSTVSDELCNNTDWDMASQEIYEKFNERTQPRDMFEDKMKLWNSLRKEIDVCIVFGS